MKSDKALLGFHSKPIGHRSSRPAWTTERLCLRKTDRQTKEKETNATLLEVAELIQKAKLAALALSSHEEALSVTDCI